MFKMGKKKILTTLLLTLTTFVSLSCNKDSLPEIDGMALVPAGEFLRGSDDVDEGKLAQQFGSPKGEFYLDERPMKKIFLKSFYIDKYEVTMKDYKKFIEKIGAQPPPLWRGSYNVPKGQENFPIVEVTWMHAGSYCKDVGKRLPTEAEWEKAARGPEGNKYPWGSSYDKSYGNLTPGANTPVGSFETDKSFYGVYDMGGNVMEWTSSDYLPYEGNDHKNKEYHRGHKVVRGGYSGSEGHYTMNSIFARTSYRHGTNQMKFGRDLGFRCAKDIAKQKKD